MTSAALFLSPGDLVDLTGKQRQGAQIRALRHMGFEFVIRPDGSPAVSWAHVNERMGVTERGRVEREPEPNWSAM